MRFSHIDNGGEFDWNKSSALYAKYRDIYPDEFIARLKNAAKIKSGMNVLDIGTGTGVIARTLYGTGARFVGVDIAEKQIDGARRLAKEQGMDIDFLCSPAEEISFPENSFGAATACQCFTYLRHEKLASKLFDVMAEGGIFAVAYMGWLPYEDDIAARSEELILKYNPRWTGCGDRPEPIDIPECYFKFFKLETQEVFSLSVPFSRESWHGRILSCRGVSAALSNEKLEDFSREHMQMLEKYAGEKFTVKHYGAVTALRRL